MKFDFVIGNPPYQEETTDVIPKSNGQVRSKSIFQYFQNEADKIASEAAVLIYPGVRWIHRSGKGMAEFGLKQINSPALKKIEFYPDASDVFPKPIELGDGVTIVIKNYNKKAPGFEYAYNSKKGVFSVNMECPGDKLIPLNPQDKIIVDKIDLFVKKHSLEYLHERILSQKLFGIESDFVEKNSDKVREYINDENIDFRHEIKLFTNDRAGKRGRAKWFVTERKNITVNSHYIDEWQVVVSSANAGGQKRANQIAIMDNHSAFGRARVALGSFKSETEAKNFFDYANTYLIKFLFLMTDESLTSLAKAVPDIGDYSNKCTLINFNEDLNSQLYNLVGFTKQEIEHIENTIKNLR